MIGFETIRDLAIETPSKILFLVMDGLGGLPHPKTRRTELETANIPHLDLLAGESNLGLTDPVAPGITPGSGPSHLALFGYDPFRFLIGRGALEATGIEFELGPDDLAIRGNFCTIDAQGQVVDRRAGRIDTERCAQLCRLLAQIELDGVQTFVEPVRDHRFVLVLRAQGLGEDISTNDPEREPAPLLPLQALKTEAEATAGLVRRWVEAARDLLSEQSPANMVLLRGYSHRPSLPSMSEVYRLKPSTVAVYPMYRGLARLLGMTVLATGATLGDQVETLKKHWDGHDFFFMHVKATDTAGEDGNFEAKVAALEAVDAVLPEIRALQPDVLVVTGDHSTPATMAAHSWHPVPFMLHSPWVRGDDAGGFNESACGRGVLGRMRATSAMPLAMAHAGKLAKYGA
jgi:2,3-bisphosphoglycerate-independent phosphoglycerate mutase